MEKQTRTSRYQNLRSQLKKESAYLEENPLLKDAFDKGHIKSSNEVIKHHEPTYSNEQIEKMISDIRKDILSNPNKTNEEKKASIKMFEERVNQARMSTTNNESIVQQINEWQKTNVRTPKRSNTITNSTRSTTMLNAVNVDLTVDDLIKARQEVVEKLKKEKDAQTSKSALRFEETITAKVSSTSIKSRPVISKRRKITKIISRTLVILLVLVLLCGLFLLVSFFFFREWAEPIFSKLKEIIG